MSSHKCTHKGVTEVWKIGDGLVFAGSKNDMEENSWPLGLDLYLNLCGLTLKAPFTTHGRASTVLAGYPALNMGAPAILEIDWPDYGVPKLKYVGAKFWTELAAFVASGKKLGIFCMGGHGRTGTALAAIAHFSGSTGDLVKEVRAIYCQSAVESDSQIEYLKKFGVQTTAEGGKVLGNWTGTGWTSGGTSFPKDWKSTTQNVPGKCQSKTSDTVWTYHRVDTVRMECDDCGTKFRKKASGEKSEGSGNATSLTSPTPQLPPAPPNPDPKETHCQTGTHQGRPHEKIKIKGTKGTFICAYCPYTETREVETKTTILEAVEDLKVRQVENKEVTEDIEDIVDVEEVEGTCVPFWTVQDRKETFPTHRVPNGLTVCYDCNTELQDYFKAQGREKAGDPLPQLPASESTSKENIDKIMKELPEEFVGD